MVRFHDNPLRNGVFPDIILRMPQWLTGSVIYEINVATFSSAGNFAGVAARLPYLKELGVNLLWLMPIHPLGKLKSKPPMGSPYAVRDYYGINPAFGTAADLHRLIDGVHADGMRVIIDIVANHTAWDSVLMEHPDFYKHDAQGHILPPNPDWTDVAGLNYANPHVRTYMIGMMEHWLRDFHLDGFRCDAAGMVPTDFWEQARLALEKVKPDLVMLAEWDSPELLRRAFDIDYAWKPYKTLHAVMTAGAPASDIRKNWEEERARYGANALHMRFVDNHDEERAIAQFGQAGTVAASVLIFTLDGVPMLYNGTEVGDATESGADALFHQLKVFWPIGNRRPKFLPLYKELIKQRRSSEVLQRGEVVWLDNSAPDSVLTYRRQLGAQAFGVALNLSNRPVSFTYSGGERKLEAWGHLTWVEGL
jgi:glycosidase